MYVRTQLLKIPEGTLAYVTEESEDDDGDGDDSDDDDADGGDDAGIQNAQTVDPRPLVPEKNTVIGWGARFTLRNRVSRGT